MKESEVLGWVPVRRAAGWRSQDLSAARHAGMHCKLAAYRGIACVQEPDTEMQIHRRQTVVKCPCPSHIAGRNAFHAPKLCHQCAGLTPP